MSLKPIDVFYWKFRGRGSGINHLLAALDVPFNSVQYTFEEKQKYGELKMKLLAGEYPLANLPMIKDPNNGDCYHAETNAIMMYLAQKYRPDAAPTMEELSDFMTHQGLVDDLLMALLLPNFSSPDKDAFKKKVMDRKDRQKSKFMYLAKTLSTTGWLFKGRFTYLDVALAYYSEIMLAWEKDLEADYAGEEARKALSAHRDKVFAMEGVKKWRSSEKFVERPFFAPSFSQWG